MKAMGIDTSQCPKIPMQPRLMKHETLELRTQETPAELSFIPRFRWGDYEAISYCWKSDVRDRKVVINHTIFEVPKNLEALLQRLRRLPDTRSGMKFWVDALCINQSDVNEKNHQVKLMQSIYSKAFAVIVWLGDATEDNDKAIEFISSITHLTLAEEGTFDPWSGQVKETLSLREEFSVLPWAALFSFFSRSYWQRLWIIQELALNHNMSLFLCGEKQLSRNMILRAFGFYQRRSGMIDNLISKELGVFRAFIPIYESIWATFYRVYCLITTGGQTQRLSTLEVVLALGRQANATDPRDKVYGILGLLPNTVAERISPNYTLSQEEVFFQLARILLEEASKLDEILSWCCFKENAPLASWIPDWTTDFSRNHLQWLRKREAAGTAPAQWSILENGRQLRCRGLIFDSIQSISYSLSETLPYRVQIHKQSLPVIGDISLSRYGDKKALSIALWKTLRQDHPFRRDPERTFFDIPWIDWGEIMDDGERGDPNICHGMEAITQNVSWEVFDQFRQTNAEFPIFGHNLRDFFPGMRDLHNGELYSCRGQPGNVLLQDADFTDQVASDMHLVVLALVGRKLITTSTGYLGLAPEEVRENDVIGILYGCNFPVVLRPNGGCYFVIGECYVEGVMDSELIEAKDRGEYQEVEVSLC